MFFPKKYITNSKNTEQHTYSTFCLRKITRLNFETSVPPPFPSLRLAAQLAVKKVAKNLKFNVRRPFFAKEDNEGTLALFSRSRVVAVRIFHVTARRLHGFTAMENGNGVAANGGDGAAAAGGDKGKKKDKRLSVERMYKKVKPIEHILLRYVSPVQFDIVLLSFSYHDT